MPRIRNRSPRVHAKQAANGGTEKGGGDPAMSDDVYEVLGPRKIRLSPTAREMAKMHNMTETQLARHLVEQHRLREAGQIQKEGEG